MFHLRDPAEQSTVVCHAVLAPRRSLVSSIYSGPRLLGAMKHVPGHASVDVCYIDQGQERFTSIARCAEGTEVVASSSSAAVRDYEDKLKAIELQRRGVEKAAVASKLGRSEKWVQKWWKQEPRLLQRPHGAQDRVFQQTPLEGFRDLEIMRKFAPDAELFETLVKKVPWRQGRVMMRDQETGDLVLRFDHRGHTIPASRMVADRPHDIPELDRLLQRAAAKANIRDPAARVVLNLYRDGTKQLNSHRHDYWTCLISLGAPRVLLVDNRPQILEHGDMIVFGTQMHGVPSMPSLMEGRISIVIFFHPDQDNLERRWLTVTSESADIKSSPADCHSTLTDMRDATALRRANWRPTNAELQFMEYPELPATTASWKYLARAAVPLNPKPLGSLVGPKQFGTWVWQGGSARRVYLLNTSYPAPPLRCH